MVAASTGWRRVVFCSRFDGCGFDHPGGLVLHRPHDPAGDTGVTELAETPQDAQMLSRRDVVISGHVGDATTARAARNDEDPRVRASALGALHRM